MAIATMTARSEINSATPCKRVGPLGDPVRLGGEIICRLGDLVRILSQVHRLGTAIALAISECTLLLGFALGHEGFGRLRLWGSVRSMSFRQDIKLHLLEAFFQKVLFPGLHLFV